MSLSMGQELTDKRCKKCGERLYRWWAQDVGGYECSGCGEHYRHEDYWERKKLNDMTSEEEIKK